MQHFRRKRILGSIWKRIVQIFRVIKSIILVLFLVSLLVYFAVAGWLYWELSRVPKVKQESVLVMNFEGFIQDRPSSDPISEKMIGGLGKTRRVMVNNIRKAAKDPRIIGILLDMGNYGMDSTTAVEIRDELIKFKETGKKVFAFVEGAGLRTYLLVSIADKIYMPPSGDTYFIGLRAEIPFFKKMFDTLGVTPEFISIGKYKTAPQIFTMERISDEYREVINNFLDALYENYVEQITAARNVSEDEVRKWIDDGIYSAADALKAGLVDELIYESQLDKTLQKELGLIEEPEEPEEQEQTKEEEKAEETEETAKSQEESQEEKQDKEQAEDQEDDEPKLNTISNAQYARIKVGAPELHEKGEKIAVIYAQGPIISGKGDPPSSNNPSIGSDSMTELISSLAEDDDIKGIIMRINSGGGGARASDIIRNALYEAKQKKPVVVSMAGVAASGGYMISAPADSIVAYPLTLTGSIGVFGGKFSMQGLLDLVGVNIEMIQRGENSGIFSSARSWTETERETFRKNVQQTYDKFIADVAESRGMTIEAVDAVAQGRVWTGKRALELGLVDRLGGLDTAIEVIKEQLDIPEDEDVQVVEYPKPESPWQQLLREFRQYPIETRLPREIEQLRGSLEELAQLQHETLFAWFPCRIVVE